MFSQGYLSTAAWHPHAFPFITNASAAKSKLREDRSYLENRVSADIYLPNSQPIDLLEFISVASRAHKFSFAPLGLGYCRYHGTDDWTLA